MDALKLFLLVTLIVVAVIFGPLLTIWALNTLFGLGIAYTFWTWLATVVLTAAIKSNYKVALK